MLRNLTFSTVMIRPSRVERFRYLTQRSASSPQSIVTNPKPLDSRVRGSTTSRHSITCNMNNFQPQIMLKGCFIHILVHITHQHVGIKASDNTFPSREKCSSRSFSVTRVDRPVTYKLFPGFKASSLELALSLFPKSHTTLSSNNPAFTLSFSYIESCRIAYTTYTPTTSQILVVPKLSVNKITKMNASWLVPPQRWRSRPPQDWRSRPWPSTWWASRWRRIRIPAEHGNITQKCLKTLLM